MATDVEIRDDLNTLLTLVGTVDAGVKLSDDRQLMVLHLFLMDRIGKELKDIHDLLDSKLP